MKMPLSVVLKKVQQLEKDGDISQCRKILKSIITAQPKQPECNYELGSLELRNGRPRDALEYFKIALSANPKKQLYWHAYVQALLDLNKKTDAIAAVQKAKSFNFPKELYNLLEEKIVQAEHNKSTLKKNLALKTKGGKSKSKQDSDPNSLKRLIGLYSSGQYKILLDQLSIAIEQFPNSATLHNLLGATYEAIGNNERALEAYNESIKIKPDYPDVHNNKGNFFLKQAQFKEAIRCFKKALAITPNYPEALNNLGLTFKKRYSSEADLDSAEKYYTKALKLNPNFSDALNNLGSVLAKKRRFKEAIESYTKALKLNPTNFKVLSNIGSAQLDQGQFGNAISTFRKCIRKMPDHLDAFNGLASALRYVGDLDSAETFLREAIQIRADDTDTWKNLGLILQKKGEFEKARECYQKTLELTNFSSPMPQRRVIVFSCLGRSGSFFFHSLIDGHPNVFTLPGAYLKGWFQEGLWNQISTDFNSPDWREKLAGNIVNQFKALFDSSSKQNVYGSPLKDTSWLAQDCGFTTMGETKDQLFKLDASKFKKELTKLLQKHEQTDCTACFELVHQAFDLSYRDNLPSSNLAEKIIFYHIHNPEPDLQARVFSAFPNCLSLTIVRHPVQSLESWMASDLSNFNKARWLDLAKKFDSMLAGIASPYNFAVKGVKLEDIKSSPQQMMKIIAEWMGIEDDPSLYLSEFCKLKYWGPSSVETGRISGFDKSAVAKPLGHFFGQNDITIFETLFWPFSKSFGYTELCERDFIEQLKAIEPLIAKPLSFEERLYDELDDNSTPLVEIPAYKYLHSELKTTWGVLMRNKTYEGMMKPLALL